RAARWRLERLARGGGEHRLSNHGRRKRRVSWRRASGVPRRRGGGGGFAASGNRDRRRRGGKPVARRRFRMVARSDRKGHYSRQPARRSGRGRGATQKWVAN